MEKNLIEKDLIELEKKYASPPHFLLIDTDDSRIYLAKSKKDFKLASDMYQDINHLIKTLRALLRSET